MMYKIQTLNNISDVIHQSLTAERYLIAKEAEWTAVRIVMAGRLAGLSADAIRERLRDAYV